MARILVVTPVHHPDDTRIREKLIRTLAAKHTVRFAAPVPGPTDDRGLRWLPLRGGRIRRHLGAWRRILFSRYELLSLHDPEMLLAGVMAAKLRRKPVVFDVHERIPEQFRRKLPRPFRGHGARFARWLLHLAEPAHSITLAAEGYADLLTETHPVFPNHLDGEALPAPIDAGDGRIVYVGDVTERRGAMDLIEAASAAELDVLIIGRADETLIRRMRAVARAAGIRFESTGHLPHPDAMDLVRRASVGVSPLRDDANSRDSLPTKALEYAALGLPIVASDLPGTREALVGLAEVMWYPPGDVAALEAALTAAHSSGARPIDQADTVRERFQWPADAVLDFYSGLIAR